MRRELETLVRSWKEDAVPTWGRYVDRPAVTDVHGVVRVPPPVVDPQLLALVGLGGIALGLWWLRTPRSRSR